MLLIANTLLCSLYKRNCICAVTNFFTRKKLFPTSASNAQAQLHFSDDQQRAFGISNISNWFTCTLRQTLRIRLQAGAARNTILHLLFNLSNDSTEI